MEPRLLGFYSIFMDTCSGGSRIFLGGRQLPKVLLFFNFLPKTAWKWKNLDPQGGRASLAPPLGSANDLDVFISWTWWWNHVVTCFILHNSSWSYMLLSGIFIGNTMITESFHSIPLNSNLIDVQHKTVSNNIVTSLSWWSLYHVRFNCIVWIHLFKMSLFCCVFDWN